MTHTVNDDGVRFADRLIPWPRSISPEAVAALKANASIPARPYPPASDTEAWRQTIIETDQIMAGYFSMPDDGLLELDTIEIGGVPVHRARPVGLSAEDRRLYIDIHGGGLVFGAGYFCRAGGAWTAATLGVEVQAVDYRMPPDHPYPTPLEDCLATYARAVEERGAANVVVGGGSAGGNLAAALMLRARDAGLPMPAGLVLKTPEVDLTESGDSFATLLGLDPVLKTCLPESIALYAAGAPLDHPYLSPLFGDLRGFPRTLLQSGTRDLFLSNTVRMHRRLREAGVVAELHVFEAMPHGGFFGAPEDAEMQREIAAFVAGCWTS